MKLEIDFTKKEITIKDETKFSDLYAKIKELGMLNYKIIIPPPISYPFYTPWIGTYPIYSSPTVQDGPIVTGTLSNAVK